MAKYAKTPFMVAGHKVGANLSSSIFLRALGEKEFAAILEKYREARLRGQAVEPTAVQYKIAEARKKGDTANDIAKKLGVAKESVYQATSRVAMWEFLNA